MASMVNGTTPHVESPEFLVSAPTEFEIRILLRHLLNSSRIR